MTNRQRLLQTSEYDLLSYVQQRFYEEKDDCLVDILDAYFGNGAACEISRCRKFIQDDWTGYGNTVEMETICNYCIAMWLNEEA